LQLVTIAWPYLSSEAKGRILAIICTEDEKSRHMMTSMGAAQTAVSHLHVPPSLD